MDESQLQESLISFMFLRETSGGPLDIPACLQLWFGKSNDTDIEIRSRFGAYVDLALRGQLDHWRVSPRGCLALMILIDQFPRNIYRHTVRSFEGDKISRDMVYTADFDWLAVLQPEECIFVPCLVMTHQECLVDQDYGLAFYERLEPSLPTALRIFRTILEEHRRIIALCGCFPHRDHYYGRTTSAVGKALMDNPAVRFDLPLCTGADGTVHFGHDPAKLWRTAQRAFDVVERIDALISHRARRRSTMTQGYMTPARKAEFGEIFRTFDKDGSGFLEVEELAAVLASAGHGYSKEQLREAVDHVTGRKGSEGLTFDQFANLLRINLSSSLEARLKERFDRFDADQSGEVSLEEFTACVQGLDALVTTAEAAAMFENCDRDGDGSISLPEFMAVMERRISSAAISPVENDAAQTNRRAGRPVFLLPAFNTSIWEDKQEALDIAIIEVAVDPQTS